MSITPKQQAEFLMNRVLITSGITEETPPKNPEPKPEPPRRPLPPDA